MGTYIKKYVALSFLVYNILRVHISSSSKIRVMVREFSCQLQKQSVIVKKGFFYERIGLRDVFHMKNSKKNIYF